MSRRRSTIHDVAALRLHPNGVRVSSVDNDVRNPTSSVVTKKSKKPSLVRRDGRGNWIAMDAGGDGRITKRRKVGEAKQKEPGEVVGSVEGDADVEPADEIPVKIFKDARANRRVAFETDFTFLSDAPQGVDTLLPQPSSDLLKCIHHFASQYYASRGQLFDSAGQYRKEKKEKRRLRMLQPSSSTSNDSEEGGSDHQGQSQVSPSDEAQEHPSKSKSKSKNKGKGKVRAKPKVKRKTVNERDMYKAFEGSALLCIGMLLQSHVVSTLKRHPFPDGWEDDFIASDEENSDQVRLVPNKKQSVAAPDGMQRQIVEGQLEQAAPEGYQSDVSQSV